MLRKKDTSYPPIVTFFGSIVVCLIVIVVVFIGIARGQLSSGRFTVVTLGEPVEVLSYDPTRDHFTLIQLTKDAHISGIFGLGEYRLDALWKLGESESTPSALLRESMAEEFGVTMPWYIARANEPFQTWDQPLSHTKMVVTLPNFIPFLRQSLESNMTPVQYIRLWWKLRSMESQKVERYILREDSGLVRKKAPDNATYLRFDRKAFDIRTTDAFEELDVRYEAKRVVVYNTTTQAAIGARVGRMIGKLGANIVAVGNDTESQVKACVVSGTDSELSSLTAQRIMVLFGCERKITTEGSQGDLTVRVGEEFARRFPVVD